MKNFIAIIGVIIMVLTLSSCVETNNDIKNYVADIKNYQAGLFMPDLENIGDYKEIEYFSRKDNGIFPEYSMQLVVKYEEEAFLKEKERLENAYTYLNEPQKNQWNDTNYTVPLEEFSAVGFDFRIVVLEDTVYPKNFGIIGISDEKYEIAYLWLYCPDLDYICEANEDRNEKMLEFIEYRFSLE